MSRAMLLLGGNIGDTRSYLERSAEMLSERGVHVVRRSTMIESEPWGFEGATNRFVNQAFEVETELKPKQLLDLTQEVEQLAGRDRAEEQQEREVSGERYASRKIDIDIIFYEDLVLHSERLTLPHPLMQHRDFVLRPIAEIAAEWQHPLLGRSCERLLSDLEKSL